MKSYIQKLVKVAQKIENKLAQNNSFSANMENYINKLTYSYNAALNQEVKNNIGEIEKYLATEEVSADNPSGVSPDIVYWINKLCDNLAKTPVLNQNPNFRQLVNLIRNEYNKSFQNQPKGQPKQSNAGIVKLLNNCFDLLNQAINKSTNQNYLRQEQFLKAFNAIRGHSRYLNSDQVKMYENLKQYFAK